uniref:Predicted protein n=1 Tax=Hordeum vulgare subsp. vulgare TaxID=112509 RepID=F2DRA4_HORVV|nr:predicted protein [Hordeum vulgare subsp. vulgare]
MTKKIKLLLQSDHSNEVEKEVESIINQLYALYHCEHATKVKEMPWLNNLAKIKNEKLKTKDEVYLKGRLDNEFGSYMREVLYEKISRQ